MQVFSQVQLLLSKTPGAVQSGSLQCVQGGSEADVKAGPKTGNILPLN